ncbi:Hypothetical protein GbCGDNIH3_7204 [Granulibacter bethesdensis]|uniref:Uncharacterized protein n=1 Tax=Granulibacter bethesdensis TaxID=364410 RepID=A0AAN0VET8_9PROT|nr:hypothetical protein [Granulibacter bethesdensis]AHJ61834.1 Hypothetical protein GbCGDNIH3_7204 [Granulibacter bethesdensis]AHJ64457.1 Hypothetical protein GbCGDNIH4_7100 [Granulibacter bethesdensis CGDNIH4]
MWAQIPPGFQFQAAFQDHFASLPLQAHAMAVVVRVLMVLAIGLLITSASYHRVAAYGYDNQ